MREIVAKENCFFFYYSFNKIEDTDLALIYNGETL